MADDRPPAWLALPQAARTLPGRVPARRLYAWIRLGVRGVHLRATALGPVLFTTRDWLDGFLDALEARAAGPDDGERLLREAGLVRVPEGR